MTQQRALIIGYSCLLCALAWIFIEPVCFPVQAATEKPSSEKRIKRLEAATEYLLGTGWEQYADKGADGIKAHADAESEEAYAKKLKAEREAK